jgi:hypothetical protein
VYRLFGFTPELPVMPGVEQPILQGIMGHHVRHGKHDVTLYDWKQYMAFAKAHFS